MSLRYATEIFLARGTADDKGQVHIHIKALEALKESEGRLPINVKVMIEGEEEVGSVSLWDFVKQNRDRLKADALVVSDTSMLAKGVPSITYGLRGLNYYQIEIAGPAQDLHSGVFGGAVPNPITILAETIAKLHDKNFRITIPGFYDDVAVLSRQERKALNSLPWKEKEFRKTVGAPATLRREGLLDRRAVWTRPTLELNGIWGGYTGEGAKTVIPSKAYAKLSTRLVPNQNPTKIAKLVERHIRKLLPKSVGCKFEVLKHREALGGSVFASDLSEGNSRAAGRIRETGCVYQGRRFNPVRYANARHVQGSLRFDGFRTAGRERARAGRTHRFGKLFRRDQGRCAVLRAVSHIIEPMLRQKTPILSGDFQHFSLRCAGRAAIVPRGIPEGGANPQLQSEEEKKLDGNTLEQVEDYRAPGRQGQHSREAGVQEAGVRLF